MKHGGKREGAGRPKGSLGGHTIEAAKMRELLIEKLAENFEEILEAHIERAKNGDIGALKVLLDRAMGRPTNSIELEVQLPTPLLSNILPKE